jgi:hypothetical protein
MYGFAAALLLSMLGSVMMPYMCQRKHMVWGFYMIAGAYVCIHGLFALLGGEHLGLIQAGECLVGALLSGLGIALIFRYCNDRIERSCQHTLKKIVFEDYELAQAMRGYSKADYDHARKVSQIAAGCARKIGVDWELCRAAGFYYRVGRLEGEPYVQSGVALARRYGFPPKLVQILAEYNGEDKLPSTVESAVVHIVDNVVAKFDVLDSSTLSSSWNHDIIVYQSLNENSAKGLYDKSGLSMNMFLLVRDYLIKEAPLYDDHT